MLEAGAEPGFAGLMFDRRYDRGGELQARDEVLRLRVHRAADGTETSQLGWKGPIGFFLHTPFPAAEMLRILPNHRELVAALCAYDLVGFQTAADLEGFRDYVLRQGGGEDLGRGRLRAFGRIVQAEVFPIGIDVDAVAQQAAAAEE